MLGIDIIVLPTTLETIGDKAFMFVRKLKEIIIPDGVTSFGIGAINNSSLRDIYIPDSVVSFGRSCFLKMDKCVFHDKKGSAAEEHIRNNYKDLG